MLTFLGCKPYPLALRGKYGGRCIHTKSMDSINTNPRGQLASNSTLNHSLQSIQDLRNSLNSSQPIGESENIILLCYWLEYG